MKKRIFLIFLVTVLLLSTSTALASTEGVKIIYKYTPESASTYSISIPADCEIYKGVDGGFGFYASDMNIPDGYEVIVRISELSYAQDGIFNLYLDGNLASPHKVPCTLKRIASEGGGVETINPGEEAVVATFRGTSKTPHTWGVLHIIPGTASAYGTYFNMLYFDISVEKI